MGGDAEFHIRITDELATLRQIAENILEQAKKTNGRITKLEDVVAQHSILIDRRAQAETRWQWWRDKIGTALIAMGIAAVGGAVMVLFQKTGIVDISIVSSEEMVTLP